MLCIGAQTTFGTTVMIIVNDRDYLTVYRCLPVILVNRISHEISDRRPCAGLDVQRMPCGSGRANGLRHDLSQFV